MMIKCPECGTEISDQAKVCPKCGCPIVDKNKEEKKVNKITGIIVALAVVAIVGIIGAGIYNNYKLKKDAEEATQHTNDCIRNIRKFYHDFDGIEDGTYDEFDDTHEDDYN